MVLRLAFGLSFFVALGSCTSEASTGDVPVRRLALVPTLGGTVYALNAGRDTGVVAVQTWQRISEFGALARRGDHIFVTSFESFGDRTLRQIAIPNGTEIQRTPFSDIEGSNAALGSVNLAFGSPFSVSDDQQSIAFALSSVSGVSGAVVAKILTRRAEWAFTPFAANAVAFGRWNDDSVLFVGGSRPATLPNVASVFVVALASRRVVDSISVGVPTFDAGGGLLQLLSVPSLQRVVALVNGDVVSCVRGPERATCTRVRVPSTSGRMWFREGDSAILVNDVGTRLNAGSGAVYAVAIDASSVRTYALPLIDGMPRVTRGISALSDGSGWVITVGTAPFFPEYPEQPAGILLFDQARRRVLTAISLPATPFGPLAF
jgi:hypothetical protein